jgi:cytokinin dehydrogenase
VLRAPTTNRAVIARLLEGNRALFESNRDIGGTHYLFGAVEMSRSDWQRHYDASWPALSAAKRRYDPDNVFASGPDVFGTNQPRTG